MQARVLVAYNRNILQRTERIERGENVLFAQVLWNLFQAMVVRAPGK